MTDPRSNSWSRRSVLLSALAGTTFPAVLTACGDGGSSTPAASGSASGGGSVLPAYVPRQLVTPDIPGVKGSDPGFITWPSKLVQSVASKPGAGGKYTAIVPIWASIPPATGNKYYEAVNEATGATVTVNPANAMTYQTMLPTLFSGDKLPDWIDIPSWNTGNLNFGKACPAKFTDLTPYLSGDNIKKYPNLANLPTNAWKKAMWNGRIYGIPQSPSGVATMGCLFYRTDIFAKAGLKEPTSADELFALGKELTRPDAGQYAFGDLWPYLSHIWAMPLGWAKDSAGKLIHQYESDAFYEATAFYRSLFDNKLVHPDDVAGNTDQFKQRFNAGKTVIYGDGTGGWGQAVNSEFQAGHKDFGMKPFDPFSANGKDAPSWELRNGAALFSYVNKKLSKDQVEEILRLADYYAAPFGSTENLLLNNGVEGVHYTMSADGPKMTDRGNKEIQTTYEFLASPPPVITMPGIPDFVKAAATWYGKLAQAGREPLFMNDNITEPSQYNAIGQPVEDTIKDYGRGRKSLADLKDAVATWRKKGGDALRTFYTEQLEKSGSQ